MRFLSLLHFEWQRVSKVYFCLFGLVSAIQLIAIYVLASTKTANLTNEALITNVPLEQIAESYSIRWDSLYGGLPIIGSIMMAIAIMLAYSLLIWYRDWFSKNNVITRLLMLPINRAQLFAAKLLLLFLLVLGLVALQIVLVTIGNKIIEAVVPSELFLAPLSMAQIMQTNRLFSLLIPLDPFVFVLAYGLGFAFLTALFSAILLERSFRVKGALLGALYLAFVFWLNSFFFISDLYSHVFPSEALLIAVATGLTTIVLSSWLSIYLIRKKVSA
ncbi:hypothetical protein SFC23_02475 [Shouchella clausii]|uniref:hypothetical protein n=1 Tax=Shouchella clausii TaxID=79880 RepID=UPI003983B870